MTPLLEARAVSKRFQGVQALDQVSASFFAGEVTAVIGENGAGKSTLMKVLAGVVEPDSGTIFWEGAEVTVPDVRTATAMGLAFIHQELNLADNLSVGANVFLGREPRKAGILVDGGEIRQRTLRLLDELGVSFSPDTLVEKLSIGQRQIVEIAKALSQDAKLLIMDEPTSSLSPRETERLFALVARLKGRGLGLVFISHRLAEVEALADRVVVLRDGRNSGELAKGDISRGRLVNLMVGRDLDLPLREVFESDDVRLSVTGLRTARFPQHEIGFSLRAGEVVGLAGLVGAGRTEILRALFGVDRAVAGSVMIDGKSLPLGRPRRAMDAGLALVPEDRKGEGVVLDLELRDNLAMPGLHKLQVAGFVNERAISRLAALMQDKLSIVAASEHQPVGQLSGGNQQKVAIAKWLLLQPKVLLLDEPTRGVDVGAKAEIYEVIETLAAKGAAVLFVSSELEEILRISDRVLVMHDGGLAGELTREQSSEHEIMRLATGTAPAAA
jgi:ribose transport system ATP-binding protein